MRSDVYIKEVMNKYDVLKQSGFWPAEPILRPRAWLGNFDKSDQPIAALLLDKFTYFDDKLTDQLLIASYNSIGDSLPKGPKAPGLNEIASVINDAVVTPVLGEKPNPTDSGNLMCRKMRQVIGISEERIVDYSAALDHACEGGCVIFVDDFVGSGNQFLEMMARIEKDASGNETGRSFHDANVSKKFMSLYVTLITTKYGREKIHEIYPETAVCSTHILADDASYRGLEYSDPSRYLDVLDLLRHSSTRLEPKESYMQGTDQKMFGFAQRGLMLGFEHSVPDATLPIFWAPGSNQWEPLIERL